jgi:hypothetical protein
MLAEIGTPEPKGQRAGGGVIHAAPLIAPDGLDSIRGCTAGRIVIVLDMFLLIAVGSPFYRANPMSSGEGLPFPRPLLQLGPVLHVFYSLSCSAR